MTKVEQLTKNLSDARRHAKLALESMIEQCYDEIRNLERFSDMRMLIATGDVKCRFDHLESAAEDLETTWDNLQDALSSDDDEREAQQQTLEVLGREISAIQEAIR